jgi:hypothetical protein
MAMANVHKQRSDASSVSKLDTTAIQNDVVSFGGAEWNKRAPHGYKLGALRRGKRVSGEKVGRDFVQGLFETVCISFNDIHQEKVILAEATIGAGEGKATFKEIQGMPNLLASTNQLPDVMLRVKIGSGTAV